MIRRFILAVSLILPGAASAADFSFSFKWCSGSPSFTLTNVPSGTAKLDLRMMDYQAPSYHHGGGVLVYKNQKTIPCGALAGMDYAGPSPPSPHTYEWTIKALDKNGAVLAKATATRRFPE